MERAIDVQRHGVWGGPPAGRVTLDYEGRFLRRKKLMTEAGDALHVDLPETVSLNAGDGLVTESGAIYEIAAAPEPLLKVEGDLPRLAWHIGNRHAPCQVMADHLLIREDHVLAEMLHGLGAEVSKLTGTFAPEGGAYGHGRTHGHSH